MRMRVWLATGVAIVVAVALAACGSSGSGGSGGGSGSSGGGSSSGGVIQLGASNAVSGAIGSVCKPVTDGANAWFHYVNAHGGINGSKLKYTVLDDAYDPARASANAHKLVNDGVIGLVGGCGTANEVAAETILKQTGNTMIGPYGDLSQFLSPANSSYFGLFPDYGLQDAAAATFGLHKWGAGTVVHVTENVPGVAAENATGAKAIAAAGGKYQGSIDVDPTTTDYTPTALKIKAMHPDYVLFSTGDAETAQIVQAMHQQGVVPGKAYLTTAATTPTLLADVGKIIEGKFGGVSAVKIEGPGTTQCAGVIKQYAQRTDDNLHGYFGCGVAQIVTSALKKVKGKVTTSSLTTALNGLQNDASAKTLGPVSFTSSNHAGVSSGTVYGVKGGKFVQIGTVKFTEPK